MLVPAEILPGEGSGPHPAQDGPHAHSALFAAGVVVTADLGSDVVRVHRVEGGVLVRTASIALQACAGPRDLVDHPSGAALVLGEHDSRIHVLEADGGGGFRLSMSVPTTVDPVDGDQAAGLQLVGDGSRSTAASAARTGSRSSTSSSARAAPSPHPLARCRAAGTGRGTTSSSASTPTYLLPL